jgi:hypothetical protein
MTVGAVIEALQADRGFRSFFTGWLSELPFQAYCWETPPLVNDILERPFECAVTESPALSRVQADIRAFAAQFESAPPGAAALSFRNLGGDARLVVPCPCESREYAHLAAFCRTAPSAQADAFWTQVGEQVRRRLDDQPFWLSTAGLGVYWLHVRLDQRPKYYRHAPYAAAGFWCGSPS